MIGQDPLRDLEGESTPRQVWERIDGIRSIRIHQPGRLCRLRRHGVVIDDANENPRLQRLGHACTICSSAVHCEDKLNAIFKCGGDRPLGDAVTITVALRDVPLSDRTDRAERSDHDRRSGKSVRIKIADHEDRLPLVACGT